MEDNLIPVMAAIALSQKAIAQASGNEEPLNTLLDDFEKTLFDQKDKMVWREILREL